MRGTASVGWLTARIDDVVEILDHKRVPLSGQERQQRQGPYPYYGAQGVIDHIDDYLFEGRHILVAEDGENLNSRKLPLALFAGGKFWVNNHAHVLRVKKELADETFVLACLNHAHIRPYITGAAQPKLSQANLRQIEIPLPPLAVQNRIAGILSGYDDLIENHARRVQILKQMARALYREWFVEFRFDGHEGLRWKPEPNGWPVVPLKSLTTKIGSGATPRGGKAAYKDVGISLIRSLNVYDDHFDQDNLAFIDTDQATGLDNVVVEERDILLNITGASVARCCMVPSHLLPARVNQHVMIVRVNPALADPFYVLDTINSVSFKKQLVAYAQGGATREALTKETVSNLGIPLPPCELLRRYGQFAQPLFQQRETLERQADNLRRTRDLLLPRLLSGQITLDEAAA